MLAVAVAPLTFMGVSLVKTSESGIQASVLELHTQVAEKVADTVRKYLKTVDDGVRFTLRAAQKSSLDWSEKQDLLKALLESYTDIAEISVVNAEGKELLKIYSPRSGLAPTSLEDRGGEPGFSAYQKHKRHVLRVTPNPGAPPTLEAYYPLQLDLALRVSSRLDGLWREIGEERVGGTGFALIVGRDGRPVLYSPQRVPPQKREAVPRLPIVLQALAAVSIGSSEYRDSDGRMQVGAYAPIPEINGAAIIQQPKDEAYLSAARMKRTAAAVICVFGLAAIALAAGMSRRLTRPVLDITRAAEEVSRGGFPDGVDVSTDDELRDLAETFNRMVAQLKKYSEVHVDRLLQEQQKTESILFSIDDGILMADQDGRIQLINRRAREILGLDAEASLEGRLVWEALPKGPLGAAVLQGMEQAGQRMLKEVDLSSDSHRLILRIFTQPVLLPRRGTQVGVVTALRDVTLEKQLDKMKEEFLHSVTHDLRNPVSSIIGFSEFLLKGTVGVLRPEQSDMVTSIQSASNRLLAMVNNILDAAKMEMGRMDIKLKPVSLAGIAGHVLNMLGALAQRRGIRLELAAEEEFSVMADADLIDRVVTNLVGNAIKFAKDDGRVAVAISDERDCLKVCVADDGVGVPAAYRDKIFEKFEQIPGQRKGGTGLGLTICKHIIDQHQGAIWVESEAGRGARFCFTLPKDLAMAPEGTVVRTGAVTQA
ncbi:MAG: HAMP domain-containing protein [Elusimicrobia bacterium]|nr:HAMP domain-containing protein [Elusimicrobiota bacterium]